MSSDDAPDLTLVPCVVCRSPCYKFLGGHLPCLLDSGRLVNAK